ncbi:uncharacterized protein LOC101848833 isoform X1 [Aplysia californica]|uniref:Uncharacterized protein LOC101848833 isoform X1 n=1 Tax=Aplysia californica TaxID=6500 RepID=A0ABM1VWH3_APLCA|nr:uncharacterized protein LOC101848833 isoform X1 [Aplysia californica]
MNNNSSCRVVFILRKSNAAVHCVESCLSGLQASAEKSDAPQELVTNVECLCLFSSGKDFLKVVLVDNDNQWISVEQLQSHLREDCGVDDSKESLLSSEEDRNKDTATVLHTVADSHPYLGSSLHVVLVLDNEDIDSPQSFVPLSGALLRLHQWHNARFTLFKLDPELSSLAVQLSQMTQAVVSSDSRGFCLARPFWEGKVNVMDRVEERGHELYGFYLMCEDWNALLEQKLMLFQQDTIEKWKGKIEAQKRDPELAVFGRTIEVLQEVDLSTLPWILLDSFVLDLHVFSGGSSAFHDHVQELTQTGLLARLRMYPDRRRVPSCGELDFINSSAWKERILSDYQNSQEPMEQSVLDDVHFLYFVMLPGADSGSVVARVLLSPPEMNVELVALIQDHEIFHDPSARHEEFPLNDSLLGDCAVLESEKVHHMIRALSTPLQDEEPGGKEEQKRVQSAHEDIFRQAREGCSTLREYMTKQSVDGSVPLDVQWIPESSRDLSVLPERRALEAAEVASRKLRSFLSMDSHPAASPICAFKEEKSSSPGHFTIDEVLSLLKKEDLQMEAPPGAVKLAGRNLCRVDSQCDLRTPWPDSQSMMFHDVYYYSSEEDLKFERRYARVRDKGYFNDTCSSFVSPKKKKKLELRRSESPVCHSTLLMTRSKSEVCQSAAPKKLGQMDSTFKQPRARPYSRSPHKRLPSSMASTPRVSQETTAKRRALLSPFASASSSSLSSLSSSLPLVRRSPRKLKSNSRARENSFSSHNSTFQETSAGRGQSIGPVQSRVRRSTLAVCSSGDFPENSSKFGSKTSRNRLTLSEDFSSEGDQSLSSGSPVLRTIPSSIHQDLPVRRSPRKLFGAPARDHEGGNSSGSETSESKSKPSRTVSAGSGRRPDQTFRVSSSGEAAPGAGQRLNSSSEQETPAKPTASATSVRREVEDKKASKLKRSERHKMRLQKIIVTALEEKGVGKDNPIHAACLRNVFNVSLVLLKTLPNSQNLTEEMKNVVYSQVQQIINLEKRRSGIAI